MGKSQQLLPNLGLKAKLLKLRDNPVGPLLFPALAPQAQPLLTWVSLVLLTQCLLNSFPLDLLSKLISLVVRFLASQREILGLRLVIYSFICL